MNITSEMTTLADLDAAISVLEQQPDKYKELIADLKSKREQILQTPTILFRTATHQLMEWPFYTKLNSLTESWVTLEDCKTYSINAGTYSVLIALVHKRLLLLSWCTWPHIADDQERIAVLLNSKHNGDDWSYGKAFGRRPSKNGYDVVCDPDVVKYVLRRSDALPKAKLIGVLTERYTFNSPENLDAVLDDLRVEWVDKYTRFTIGFYDGYESIE